jgi:peroxiredoxin Q/BCP
MISIGSNVPLFELKDQDGKIFRIADHLGKRNLVLFFYPKDLSYGCTKEACSFRDHHEVFLENDCDVIGISMDNESSHREFIARHRLPYTLLSDTEKKVQQLFGLKPQFFGLVQDRATFVIGKNGKILHAFRSLSKFEKHVSEALEILKKQ